MSIKAVLFDLDGTLLKMDQDEFVRMYFKYLAKHLAPKGYEPDKLLKVFWAGLGPEDFAEYGSYTACKDKGVTRLEGKEYVVQDGDIVHFRFAV